MPMGGCTIYVTHIPCADCTRAIVQVGIERVVVNAAFQDDPGFEERWGADFRLCEEMMGEAGVNIDFVRIDPADAESNG